MSTQPRINSPSLGSDTIKAFVCAECNYHCTVERKPIKCPRCWTQNALFPESVEKAKEKGDVKKSELQKHAVRIGNVVIEPFDPYSSQVPSFDRVVGGLSKGFSIFLAGGMGVGKSTLVTQICMESCLADPNFVVFYASAEEPLSRFVDRAFRLGYGCAACVKSKTGKCKIKHDPRVYASMKALRERFYGSRQTDILSLHKQIRKFKPNLVIYDSIRRFSHPGLKAHSYLVHGPEVVGEIVDLTEELKCCAIAIIRLTKDGKLSGSEDMGYDFDCIVKLDRHKNHKKYIQLTCSKNRMGPEHKIGWFKMTGAGILSCGRPKKTQRKAMGSSTKGRRVDHGQRKAAGKAPRAVRKR